MPDYVRARQNDTGHHKTILRSQYERNASAWTLLKSPATYPDGSPLPDKHKTSVSSEADKKADQSAATKKEI